MKKRRRLYRKFQCPCCGNYALNKPADGNYDICPVCFWEDDDIAYVEPDEEISCNDVSFNQAKRNYEAFGCCKEDLKEYARKPMGREKKGQKVMIINPEMFM